MNRAQADAALPALSQEIKSLALSLGFHRVGITSAEPLETAGAHLRRWLGDGYAADMAYLQKSPEIRSDPKQRFPQAESVVCLALNYAQASPDPKEQGSIDAKPRETTTAPLGKVARYAWGEDYHLIIEEKLETLIQEITARGGRCWKGYVDHGPLLERAFAQRAGLGFIGKNTNLITPDFGSWVFLAEVVTDLKLIPDAPAAGQCGTCRRCLDACPTGALTEAYRLDARRCISYLTIENKGPIPEAYVPHLEGWIFGCDICQEVCPFNGHPIPTDTPRLSYRMGVGPRLFTDEIEAIPDNAAFKERFARSPLLRAKHSGLSRNAAALSQSSGPLR